MNTIDVAAYVKLENRVRELEAMLGKLKGNLASSPVSSLFPIDSKTAGVGGSASFDFQNIPATFSALRLILSVRSVKAAVTQDSLFATFNASGAASYYEEDVYASAAAAAGYERRAATSVQIAVCPAASSPSGSFGVADILFPDYANANKLPTYVGTSFSLRATTTTNLVPSATGGALNVAGALSRITMAFAADNIAQYSAAWLLGVK